ncbi:MAG TPA: hypothetical protein DCR97_09005, partial [Deltaproteobacteria bacterium]|nr:hypothetical protein [Deltaproteobacteria bacterium]
MHSLLRRQLRQHRIDFESLPVAVKGLLEVVDKAYQQFDDDRAMLERAFELSSEELIQVNEELSNHREQLERLVNMRTRELTKANSRLIGEVAERKRLEERLANLSECLINLTENHAENTGRLVNLCGTSLDASHAFYNHVAGDHVDHICSWSADGEPAGCFHHVDHGFCLSFINDLSAGVCVNTIRRPAREEFSDEIADRFDPCVGIPVSLGSGKRIGALCVVNRDYQVVSEADKRFLRLLASALGSEEEREWTANALRESEEKFRSISMSAQDAIVMANRGGNISYWNPAAEGIIGYDREEILGRSIRICIPSPAFDQAFASLFTDDRGVRDHERPKSGIIEVEAKRKDGGAVAIELSLSAVAFDNERHAIVIFRDVSKRKNAVQELRNAAAAAEAASRAKSQFLANMSHEIRTP